MASTRLKTTKTGKRYYEIRVFRGSGQTGLSSRWYVPDGWSQRAVDRELAKVSAEFERKVKAGEIISRAEKNQLAEERKKEEAKILTVRQYSEAVFMPMKREKCKETTRSFYQDKLDLHIYPAIGDKRITEITTADLDKLLLGLKKYSYSLRISVFTLLNQIFQSAYKKDMIERNPMDKVERPGKSKELLKNDSVEAYTADEILYIMECVENEPLDRRVFIRLLIDSGMRRGEACALRWSNVDFSEGTITIRENLCYTKERGLHVTTPKNGRARTIDIDPEVMDLLRSLRASQKVIDPEGYVFTKQYSIEPMYPSNITGYFESFGKKYGIENFHPHKLRHSFASIALTNNADLISVSKKLGHSNPSITASVYAHSNAEAIKRAGNIFRDVLKQKNA